MKSIEILSDALKQFQNADFGRVVESIGDRSGFYDLLLSSRALTRLGRPDAAIDVLSKLKALSSPRRLSADERIELNVTLAFPAISSRQFEIAREALRSARSQIVFEHSIDLETELHYAEAALFFATGDFEEARRSANRALSAADDFFSGDARPAFSASYKEHHRAKSLQLLAVICSNQARYHEQANLIRTALKALERCKARDAYTTALLKLNLSFYVRDLDSAIDANLVEPDEWPSDLHSLSAEIMRSIGLFRAVQGEMSAFNENLTTAAEKAPSAAFTWILLTDRALISRCTTGEILSEDLLSAYNGASAMPWPAELRYRDALYLLAQELSFIDVNRSRQLLEIFGENEITTNPFILHDRRNQAELSFAVATVERNSNESSVEKFFEAFEMWNNVGYRKYAAMAAAELAELTKRETFVAYARREAELRPGSWLDLRVRRMKL